MTDNERKLLLLLSTVVLQLTHDETPERDDIKAICGLADDIEAMLDADAPTPD